MTLVSIVLPVYNSDRYLQRCVRSVLAQTHRDLEIIIVNDGSTDDSGAICDNLQREDPRIIVFHNANSGVSASRNFGMDKVHGDFITFIDSDDYVEPDYIEKILQSVDEDTDFVLCNFSMINDDTGNKSNYETVSPGNNKTETLRDLFVHGWIFIIGILFRTRFLKQNHLRFPEHINYTEDIWFLTRAVVYARKVQKVTDVLYNYNVSNPVSITHLSHNIAAERTRLRSLEETIAFLKQNSLFDPCRKEVYWRILVWKTWVVRRPDCFQFFNENIPEANRFIRSNPFISWRMKLMLLSIDKKCFILARFLSFLSTPK